MTRQIVPCSLVSTPIGWWLQFPEDRTAGLVFDTTLEKFEFLRSCGFEDEEEMSYLELDEIETCPVGWYEKALEVVAPF